MATRTSRTSRARAARHRAPAPPRAPAPADQTNAWQWIAIVAIILAVLGMVFSYFRRWDVETLPQRGAANATSIAALEAALMRTPTATPAPTAAPNASIISLNYDNGEAKGDCMTTDNAKSDPLMPKQKNYIAYYICVANSAGQKQADLEAAMKQIQDEADVVGAKTLSGNKITLDNETAWLIWLPNAVTMDYTTVPNDTAYPASLKHPAVGQIWIVPPYASGINGRTFQKPDSTFWAVALH